MSKLDGLKGKSKVYKIGDIDLELKPLVLDDMNLMNIDEKSSSKEQQKATMELITKTLKESVPDATNEEIKNIGFTYMEELMNAIMDVNGLNKQNAKTSIIKNRLNAIKQSQESGSKTA